MFRFLVLLFLAVLSGKAPAQNLVPNGSFEDHTTCPEFYGFAQYATGWLNLHTASADYFNACSTNSETDVPWNQFGYQEPAAGDAYIGLATTFPGLGWYREIVGIELSEPLAAGVPVCLSFKMALGGFGLWDGASAMFTSKGVGVSFFNAFPMDWPAYLYPNAAAIAMEMVPTDTAIWYLVDGVYTPDSNYTHLAIGNFFSDSASSIQPLDTAGSGAWGVSYAFIDDVRVSGDLQFCGSSGVHSGEIIGGVHAYPNPFTDQFTVLLPSNTHGVVGWDVVDLLGQPVLSGTDRSGGGSFVVVAKDLAQGSYVLRIQDNTGAVASVRLVAVSPNP